MGEEAIPVGVDHPASLIQAGGIPLIDFSPLTTPASTDPSNQTAAKQSLIAQLRYACEKWGFFQVINHGVSSEKREKLEMVAKTFFRQSGEEKRKVRRDENNPYGYHDAEHTMGVRDSKQVFDFAADNQVWLPASDDPDDDDLTVYASQWPQHPPELREVCEEYVKEMQILAYKLSGLIALSLGLPENRLHGFFNFKGATGFARLSYYPHQPAPHHGFGIGPHKDAGLITILTQDDVGGLEVRRKSDGEWISIKPTPSAYIINVGDVLQVLSNDKYESAEHRVVVNRERDRFSLPFFLCPSYDVNVEPLKELTDERNPPKYKPYNWGKYRVARNRSNFMKTNHIVQIRHLKISE